jgi:hypothetical protein
MQQIFHIPSDRLIYLKTGRMTSSVNLTTTPFSINCHTGLFSDNYPWQPTWHHTDKRHHTNHYSTL